MQRVLILDAKMRNFQKGKRPKMVAAIAITLR